MQQEEAWQQVTGRRRRQSGLTQAMRALRALIAGTGSSRRRPEWACEVCATPNFMENQACRGRMERLADQLLAQASASEPQTDEAWIAGVCGKAGLA